MFEKIKYKRVYEEVVDLIVSRICSGDLKVGQKLPPERVLADDLGVSRTSLRDALRALESMGYIRSASGSGHYINKIMLENIFPPFSAMAAQDKQLVADIIEVRECLEVRMAAMAAKHASKEQLDRIYGAILDMQAEIEQGGNGLAGDNSFHLEIAKASNNCGFALIAELCFELLTQSRQATLNIPGQPAKTVSDHMAIFEAIRDGDEKRASQEMASHLDKAQFNIKKYDANESDGTTFPKLYRAI